MIRIITGFEGSCPHSAKGVKKLGPNHFMICPNWKPKYGTGEEGPGGGFNFYIKVANAAKTRQPVRLDIDWQAKPLYIHRGNDYLHIRGENDGEWRFVPAPFAGSVSIAEFVVDPGETKVGLFPAYSCSDCAAFVKTIEKDRRFKVNIYGKSQEGRALYAVSLPGIKRKGRVHPLVVITARSHAYETSGNYCVEGIADFLRGETDMARYFRSKFDFIILPMLNPDGVANGLSRCTAIRGANMNRVVTTEDRAHRALRRYFARLSPAVFIDFHHWAQRFEYGVSTTKRWQGEKIAQLLQGEALQAFKLFHLSTLDDQIRAACGPIPPEDRYWRNYFEIKCDAMGALFELPWIWKTTAQMRQLGARTLSAVLTVWMQDHNA